MAAKNETLRRLFERAEQKFGFRYACELHQELRSGCPTVATSMMRRVLA